MNTPLLGVIYAVIAALSYALWNIFLQRALQRGASAKLSLVTLNLVYLVLFVPAVLLLWRAGSIPALSPAGLAWYAGAGFLTAFLGPMCTAKATPRLGVSLTTALRLLDPLFALLLAIIFLGERLNLQVGLGITMIILALLALQGFGQGGHAAAGADRMGVGMGILSSISFSTGSVARKFGLILIPSAFVAAMMEGVVGILFALITMNRQNWADLRRSFTAASRDLWLSGLAAASGTLCLNLALQSVPVPVAVALRNTSPWFALFLVPWLIGQHARAGRNLWTSTIAMTAGMLLIVLR